MVTEKVYRDYIRILNAELVPAMGCTEPISLAYGAAKCREILGEMPKSIHALCSGNIVKNVRCVKIPHSGGMVGIEAAVALGAIGGNSSLELEVLSTAGQADIEATEAYLAEGRVTVELLDSNVPLHFILVMEGESDRAEIEICESHINVVRISMNGEDIYKADYSESEKLNYDSLDLHDIKEFADTVALSDVVHLLDRQISYNMAIAEEGLDGKYGIGIGKIIGDSYPDSPLTEMKVMASSASEARMGGCELPVIVNSGSGNQGITTSVPVIVYAARMGYDREVLYRGLVFSNLLAVYQKMYIGKLSAFCGAVSAACAAGATLTYMDRGDVVSIQHTIENTLANIPGIICDGAKISCAAKIVSSIDAAYLAHQMSMRGAVYNPHTGILQADTSKTISCVGRVGKDGMRETDREILRIMLDSTKNS